MAVTTFVRDMTIADLEHEGFRLSSLLGQQEAALADTKNRLGEVRAELSKRLRPAPEPRVSDHAILRFLERSMGIDIAALRNRLLSDSAKAAIKAGASAVVVDGIRFKVQDNTIVTVLDGSEKPRFKKARRDKVRPEQTVEDGLQDYYEERA